METEIEVNDSNFEEEVIEKSKQTPVIVDFWAGWCAPCLILGPTLEKLTKEYKGKFILAKLDVEESPRTSRIYKIMSIPNVKMFKDGRLVQGFVGVLPEDVVKEWLDKNLDK